MEKGKHGGPFNFRSDKAGTATYRLLGRPLADVLFLISSFLTGDGAKFKALILQK